MSVILRHCLLCNGDGTMLWKRRGPMCSVTVLRLQEDEIIANIIQ